MFVNRIKLPKTESPSKNNPENCIVYSEKATDDVFECCWYESRQHSACAKITADLSSMLNNVVFFLFNLP